MESKPVLAQYTIRSKQDYIFKTNKILEIVGASVNIRNAWDKLFKCADCLGMKYKKSDDSKYDDNEIRNSFANGSLSFVELFIGGGNETLLFRNRETFIELNKEFSKTLLIECPGMIPMAVCVEATDNYSVDYVELMKYAEKEKNKMTPGQRNFIMPFSMIDKDTFLPYTKTENEERYSEESYRKRKIGIEERDNDKTVKILDDMITKKSEESLLAVVHADGNNMGSKIIDMLEGKTTYNDCVELMREFTKETAKVFSDIGIKAIKDRQNELLKKGINHSQIAFRVIIRDGDDMTFICNARYVFEYVTAYVKAVQNYNSKWQYSSCAGICIFHSHYPFSKAYELAEQACDGAKRKVHAIDSEGKSKSIDEGWVDFHYIHNGVGGNIDDIRRVHNTESIIARPWLVSGDNNTCYKLDNIYKLHELLIIKNKVARTSIKSIGVSYEQSKESGIKELHRLYNHMDRNKSEILKSGMKQLFGSEDEQLKAMYDYSEIFDLVFKEV